ncbi:MAG: hypothetical protein CL471_05495 [Acidobacteria bacterium]|jgi:hypothetical protein|nr:hypothetical protein [Acidobacteriota bacterium]
MPRRNERGQALTETLLLSWLVLVLMAAAYQIFIVNETIFRSITAVHQQLFERAFENNCYSQATVKCAYDSNFRNLVIWRPEDIPEVEIPVVGIFEEFGLVAPRRLSSNVWSDGLKRTKVAAGTYYPIFPCSWPWNTCLE